jgi:predicted porin
MKKSTLALAIAAVVGVSTAAQADTTLYGSARPSVDWLNPGLRNKSFSNFYGVDNTQNWQVTNNQSRLGVQGSEDLGGGWSANYQFEFAVNMTGGIEDFTLNENRPKWVGLQSDFGSVTLGTQYTPYYNVLGYMDSLQSIRSFDYFLYGTTSQGTPILYQRGVAQSRRPFTAVYTTPTWNGLSAQGMIQMNGTENVYNDPAGKSPTSIDSWEANIIYNNSPWFIGAAVINEKDGVYATSLNADGTAHIIRQNDFEYGVVLGYDNKQIAVTFGWQQYNPGNTNQPFFAPGCVDIPTYPDTININPALANLCIGHELTNAYAGQLTYTFGDEVVRATYAYTTFAHSPTNIQNMELGFQHNLSKRTMLWAEYLYALQHLQSIGPAPGTNAGNQVVSLGIRHDF